MCITPCLAHTIEGLSDPEVVRMLNFDCAAVAAPPPPVDGVGEGAPKCGDVDRARERASPPPSALAAASAAAISSGSLSRTSRAGAGADSGEGVGFAAGTGDDASYSSDSSVDPTDAAAVAAAAGGTLLPRARDDEGGFARWLPPSPLPPPVAAAKGGGKAPAATSICDLLPEDAAATNGVVPGSSPGVSTLKTAGFAARTGEKTSPWFPTISRNIYNKIDV